jgi:stage III sporulation protein SpoIIIAA
VQLVEIVMDLGRKPVARFQHEEAVLSEEAVTHKLLGTVISQVPATCAAAAGLPVLGCMAVALAAGMHTVRSSASTTHHCFKRCPVSLACVVPEAISSWCTVRIWCARLESVATARKECLQHWLVSCGQVGEFGEDNRAGIDRTLHRISCLRNRDGGIVGLTCRVGRAVPGSAALIADLARSGKSILLLGRPGSGKTTLLRDVSRMLAAECRRRVVIVDTRCRMFQCMTSFSLC